MKNSNYHSPAIARSLLIVVAWFSSSLSVQAQNFTYDFPGTPGSGVAASQSNATPSGGSFSDFTRVTVTADSGTGGLFSSLNWSLATSVDLNQYYVSYSVTPNSGNVSFLRQVSFDYLRATSGPTSGQISLFSSGGATILETASFSPTTSSQTTVFDFTDIITAEALTFRLYGWNATSTTRQLAFDNVATTGGSSTFQASSTNISFNATTRIYADSSTLSLSGILSGAQNVIKGGSSMVTLSGASSYSGSTTVNFGTLRIDSAGSTSARLAGTSSIIINTASTLFFANSSATASIDRIRDAASITLNGGGTLNTGGLSEGTRPSASTGGTSGIAGLGALTLGSTSSSSKAVIDFASGANGSSLVFTNLAGAAGAFVNVLHFNGLAGTDNGTSSNDRLLFDINPGLTNAQLANWAFFNDAGAAFTIGGTIITYGDMFELVPVPEPDTWIAAALTLLATGWHQRRRIQGRLLR